MEKHLLFADNKPIDAFDRLEEAKAAAEAYLARNSLVRIETYSDGSARVPVPMTSYRYDREIKDWVRE